jgi:radical SAM superfamily enzyme YgiQ (UPF0313 family)
MGHASLVASLRDHDRIQVREVIMAVGPDFTCTKTVNHILWTMSLNAKTSWVGFGAYLWNVRLVRSLVRQLRYRGFKGRIVIGGPSVTYLDGGLEQAFPGADFFIRGYAEVALPALILGGGSCNLPKGVSRSGASDLGLIASPSLADLKSPILTGVSGLVGSDGLARLETKRGCPGNCSFCQHNGGSPGCKEYPLARIRSEVEALVAAGVKRLKIVDPQFNIHGTNYLEVLRLLLEFGFKGDLTVEGRMESTTPKFVELCAKLGATVKYGLQTAVAGEELPINRHNSKPAMERAAAMHHALGVPFSLSVMFGLPLQTPASFRTTLDYAGHLRPSELEAFLLEVYPGTALDRDRSKWGLIVSEGHLPQVLSTATASAENIREMARMAEAARASYLQKAA